MRLCNRVAFYRTGRNQTSVSDT